MREENYSRSNREWLASIHGVAKTYKITADVQDADVQSGLPVAIASDGTAKLYTTGTPTIAEGEKVGLLVSDRVADKDGKLNGAVMIHGVIRRSHLPEVTKNVLEASADAVEPGLVIYEA